MISETPFHYLNLTWISLAFLLAATLYYFFLKPFFLVQYYKLQGAHGKYTPGLGFLMARYRDVETHGDFMHYFKTQLESSKKELPMLVTNLGSRVLLYLTDPNFVIKDFSRNAPSSYVFYDPFSDIPSHIRRQIRFSEGVTSKIPRQIVTQVFHHHNLKDIIPQMVATADFFYNDLLFGKLDRVNMTKVNQRIAGETFGKFFFGERFAKSTFEGKPLSIALDELFSLCFDQKHQGWDSLIRSYFTRNSLTQKAKKIEKRLNGIRKICYGMIEDKRKFIDNDEEEKEKSLLQLFIDNQRDSVDKCMTDEEIVDTFFGLYSAGTENVGDLVTMSLYYLAQNKYRYEKLMTELNPVIKDKEKKKDIIDPRTLKNMNYLLAVLKETLRLASPKAFLPIRKVQKSHKLGTVRVLPGTLVTSSPLFNGCNGKYFPMPSEFLPERWLLPDSIYLREQLSLCEPFSLGPQVCLGKSWALLQGKVMLVSFLRRFKIEDVVENKQLKMTYTSCYKPVDDIKMSLVPLETNPTK